MNKKHVKKEEKIEILDFPVICKRGEKEKKHSQESVTIFFESCQNFFCSFSCVLFVITEGFEELRLESKESHQNLSQLLFVCLDFFRFLSLLISLLLLHSFSRLCFVPSCPTRNKGAYIAWPRLKIGVNIVSFPCTRTVTRLTRPDLGLSIINF